MKPPCEIRRRHQRGQIVIEYILLLIITVAIGAILVRGLANRSEGETGLVVDKWRSIQEEIGKDLPDRCAEGSSGASNCNRE